MQVTTGIDIIEIKRIENAIARHGDHFLRRVFTPIETADCRGNVASLAVRFTAKEAAAKALGSGIGQVGWQDLEIIRGPANQPQLKLHGAAAEIAQEQDWQSWSISLSHSLEYATAIVIAILR